MHRLLQRQLRRYLNTETNIPKEFQRLIQAVDAAYQQADDDRALIERSLELTSQELLGRNEQLRQRREELKKMVSERTAALENRNIQLQIAAEIARDATTSRNLDDLLTRAVNLLHERFGFYHIAIYLVDDQGENAVLVAASGEASKQMVDQQQKLGLESDNIVSYAVKRSEAGTEKNAKTATHTQLPETRSELALPLKGIERVIGAINIHSQEKDAFEEDLVSVLQILADQLAVAISNTLLLQETAQTLAELEAATSRYTKEAWQQVATRPDAPVGYRYRGIGVEPISRRQDVSDQPIPDTEQNIGEEGKKISVPIRMREQVIGTMNLSIEEKETLPEISMLAESVAERMALALENARLLEETQRRAEQERLVANVAAQMRQTLDVDTVIKNAVTEMRQALGLQDIQIQLEGNQPTDFDPNQISSLEKR